MKLLTRLLMLASCFAAVPAAAQVRPGPASATPAFDRPVEAGSWGGIVRNGPGQSHARVASLREGERVSLLFNTGVMWNDYPWFLIRFRNGELGFQWGGILCRLETPVEGVFEACRR